MTVTTSGYLPTTSYVAPIVQNVAPAVSYSTPAVTTPTVVAPATSYSSSYSAGYPTLPNVTSPYGSPSSAGSIVQADGTIVTRWVQLRIRQAIQVTLASQQRLIKASQ